MNPLLFGIVFVHLSLTTAVNFTQVFEWPHGMDYVWSSEAKRTRALKDGTFKPENIYPLFMAVYGTRIFLSLYKYRDIPASLVSLPTSSASSAPPKLTPFPSWEMHVRVNSKGKGDCNKIQEARGLQADSVGRLWVLDSGSENCSTKLWTIDLSNNHTVLGHRFSFRDYMPDLVLDETPNGTLAFISNYGSDRIVILSLERKESWIVQTPGNMVYSISLAPKEEPRQLYLSTWNSNELFSIPVTALCKGTQTAYPKLIGKWSAIPYRMLIDSHGTMYAAFRWKNYIRSWNTSQPFEKQPFYEVEKLGISFPFTFGLDSSGTFWMTELNKTATKPRYRLLKAAVGDLSITPARPTTATISPKTEPTPVSLSITTTTKSSTPAEENGATEVQKSSTLIENSNENRIIIISLICSNVFIVVLSSSIILWLVLKLKRNNSLPQNTAEDQEMSVSSDNYDEFGPSEVQYEEVTKSRPFHLVPTISRFVSARDTSESNTCVAENVREIWRGASFENYDVGPAQPEPWYDEVASVPSRSPHYEDTSSRMMQYL